MKVFVESDVLVSFAKTSGGGDDWLGDRAGEFLAAVQKGEYDAVTPDAVLLEMFLMFYGEIPTADIVKALNAVRSLDNLEFIETDQLTYLDSAVYSQEESTTPFDSVYIQAAMDRLDELDAILSSDNRYGAFDLWVDLKSDDWREKLEEFVP